MSRLVNSERSFFYDLIGGRTILPGTAKLDLSVSAEGEPPKKDENTMLQIYVSIWLIAFLDHF